MRKGVQSFQAQSSTGVRQDVYPFHDWVITTRKGIIMQSQCTCRREDVGNPREKQTKESTASNSPPCTICKFSGLLPNLPNKPDMLFHDNFVRLQHSCGAGIEFNPLDALRLVEETQDPLKVAVAGGWQSARADCPFARQVAKPFDWTFTTNYKGTLLTTARLRQIDIAATVSSQDQGIQDNCESLSAPPPMSKDANQDLLIQFSVEETSDRIDINKLKVREEILFYDEVTLYEDELADHGEARYSVKVRVMPTSLFILARYFLRVDGVLARINDTRVYHELGTRYLLREYTNREARLAELSLPVSTIVDPTQLMNHLPIVDSSYEKLTLPRLMSTNKRN